MIQTAEEAYHQGRLAGLEEAFSLVLLAIANRSPSYWITDELKNRIDSLRKEKEEE